jgi:hypothetical protein
LAVSKFSPIPSTGAYPIHSRPCRELKMVRAIGMPLTTTRPRNVAALNSAGHTGSVGFNIGAVGDLRRWSPLNTLGDGLLGLASFACQQHNSAPKHVRRTDPACPQVYVLSRAIFTIRQRCHVPLQHVRGHESSIVGRKQASLVGHRLSSQRLRDWEV